MNNSLKEISDLGILPVIAIPSAENAEPLAQALCDGGIPAIEVTLRNECALEAIRRIHTAFPQMVIGAGTVLHLDQVDAALNAGASFIVSPGLDEEIVRGCQQRDLPIVPGCSSPSEVTAAVKMGLKTLKFFPAESAGGIKALNLMHGPFADCSFVPTGGLNFDNIIPYLEKSYIAACGGSFIAKSSDITSGNWSLITENCKRCMDISLGIEFDHIGINHSSEEDSLCTAGLFEKLVRQPSNRDSANSIFSSKNIENMKALKPGLHGHIGYTARSVKRALAWYTKEGIAIRPESIKYDSAGEPTFFYLKQQIGGFAIHITKRQ